jgi:N-acetylglucosamine-6-sulfatase
VSGSCSALRRKTARLVHRSTISLAAAALLVAAIVISQVRDVPGSTPPPPSATMGTPGAPASPVPPDRPPGDTVRPTIVLILTDDQRWDTVYAMPEVIAHIASKGITFRNAFVVNSYCCPSRASILTGNYSHTTQIWTNGEGELGGWRRFHERGEESSTVATWLHAAGYHTALFGKYLNGFGEAGSWVPPGWDSWFAFSHGNADYYDYDVNHDGSIVHFGWRPDDYSTEVLAGEAVRTIRETPSEEPLFLYFSPFAPHGPATPAPRDVGATMVVPAPRPSFNEDDVSDKPPYIRRLHLTGQYVRSAWWERQLVALQSIDRAVGQIVEALRATGRLRDAMLVFTSDNGYMAGEHRWFHKLAPYDESIRVPMIVRSGSATRGPGRASALVLNIDLAPTLARAGAAHVPAVDGRSMLPLIEGRTVEWRTGFPVEHVTIDAEGPPTFCAVRTFRWLYAVYADGFEELYDLRHDPYELYNLAGSEAFAGSVERLRERARGLCSPRPPDMPPF